MGTGPSGYRKAPMGKTNIVIFLVLFFIFLSCQKSESDGNEEYLVALIQNASETSSESTTSDSACSPSSSSEGISTATINATDQSAWVLCDLKESASTSRDDSVWDIGFQRFKVQTNSGTSGSHQGGSCDTGSTDFGSTFDASSCSLASDTSLSQEGGGSGGSSAVSWSGSSAFFDWYSYSESHVLTSRNHVYLVQSGDGATLYKVQVLDYYSGAGTPAYMTVRWAVVGE